MIDPKSLRIGNYIQDKKDGTTTILQVAHLSEGLINYWNASVYQPIPLSEQELIRLGFENRGEQPMSDKLGQYTKYPIGLWLMGSCFITAGEFDVDLKYVHQLQNLFYALCGQELTYK